MKRKLNYEQRISTALPALALIGNMRGALSNTQIQHDDDCRLLIGKGSCSCCPDILVSTPGGLFQIDQHGNVLPARTQWADGGPLSKIQPHKTQLN